MVGKAEDIVSRYFKQSAVGYLCEFPTVQSTHYGEQFRYMVVYSTLNVEHQQQYDSDSGWGTPSRWLQIYFYSAPRQNKVLSHRVDLLFDDKGEVAEVVFGRKIPTQRGFKINYSYARREEGIFEEYLTAVDRYLSLMHTCQPSILNAGHPLLCPEPMDIVNVKHVGGSGPSSERW